jgi:hypothetical protein
VGVIFLLFKAGACLTHVTLPLPLD